MLQAQALSSLKSPIGDSSNSEAANTAMIPTTSKAGTALPVVPDIGRNSRNASPIPITP